MKIAEAFLYNEMVRNSIEAGGPGSGPHGSETAKNSKAVATTGKAAMKHGYVKTNGVARHYYLPDKVNNPRYEHQVQIHENGSWTHHAQNGKKVKGDTPEQLHEHLTKLHGTKDVAAGGPGSGPQPGGGSGPHPGGKLDIAHGILTKHGFEHVGSKESYGHTNHQYKDKAGNKMLITDSSLKKEHGGGLGRWEHTSTTGKSTSGNESTKGMDNFLKSRGSKMSAGGPGSGPHPGGGAPRTPMGDIYKGEPPRKPSTDPKFKENEKVFHEAKRRASEGTMKSLQKSLGIAKRNNNAAEVSRVSKLIQKASSEYKTHESALKNLYSGGPGSGPHPGGGSHDAAQETHKVITSHPFNMDKRTGAGATAITHYYGTGQNKGAIMMHDQTGAWSHHNYRGESVGHGPDAASLREHLKSKGFQERT